MESRCYHDSERALLNQIVPPRFLFRWSFTAPRIPNLPRPSGRLLDLPDECLLPCLSDLDNRPEFAKVKLAWNNDGFGISVEVSGRSQRPKLAQGENAQPDGVWIWIDTRNMQTVHRATKFCHHFIVMPLGGGPRQNAPLVKCLPVARAREETTLADPSLIRVQSEMTSTGYWLDAWFPGNVFAGFDPDTNDRIGFHYSIHDYEMGNQTLAVGSEFPFESDPSLWQTVELVP